VNFTETTHQFEKWLAQQTPLVKADMVLKHVRLKQSQFQFLRGTYYRWSELWPTICASLTNAPAGLAVGDLHLQNFGTWRDSEGRLIWGINDFDEARPLPYTNDLVRLAVSARLASDEYKIDIKLKEIAATLLSGYSEGLAAGGKPFVLAEAEPWLGERIAAAERNPQEFWNKLLALPTDTFPLPETCRSAMETLLPEPGLPYQLVRRVAGMGSLGQPRWVALAQWQGGHIAREVKSTIPGGFWWESTHPTSSYAAILAQAVRAPDPILHIGEGWIVRRLAPDCLKVGFGDLRQTSDFAKLLYVMGWETANIHLGTHNSQAILADLKQRPSDWLRTATTDMVTATVADFDEWRAK